MAECSRQMSFSHLEKTPVVVDFDGGAITGDAGAVFLREVDEKLGLSANLAACLLDRRDQTKVRHHRIEQVRQRVYQIACGYCDANDADTLRKDPAIKAAVGRAPVSTPDLASQPSLSRLENAVSAGEIGRMSHVLLQTWLRNRPRPTKAIVLDFDVTDDIVHGQQQFSFFSGFYGNYVYLPLLCYDGETGDLIALKLRPGNVHTGHGMLSMLKGIVRGIRATWPGVEIIVRADAGFALPELYEFCERRNLGYLIGFGSNRRLEALHAPLMAEAVRRYQAEGEKVRIIGEAGYRAGTWSRFRRLLMKAEAMPEGTNRRFVITNLLADATLLFNFYNRRGDAENRIKDLKRGLYADRLSCHRFQANSFRLLLHAAAYVLLHSLRSVSGDTEIERSQFDILRLRLLKAGARVVETSRKVWVHVSSTYPYRELWYRLHARLTIQLPLPAS